MNHNKPMYEKLYVFINKGRFGGGEGYESCIMIA